MPQHERVRVSLSRVAQPQLTLVAVPGGVGALLAPTVAPVTSGPSVLGLLGGIIFGDGCGIVAERESTDDTCSTTADPSSTAVVTNELRCQLQPERFDGGAWYTATVALLQDVGVRDETENEIYHRVGRLYK